MISTHTPNSRRGSWFQKLAMLASGLVVATLATAGSVTISGTVNASCASWSSVSGDGTNITYVCGTSQSSTGGSFTLSVPATLDVSRTYLASESNIAVTRNGGSVDTTVTVAGNAGCTVNDTSLVWANSTGGPQGIGVTTAAAGPCTISISVPAGGTGSGSKNIALADPNAAVVFAFELATIPNTSFGVSAPTVIRVKRAGGSQGDWTVPILLGGFMSNAAAGSVTPSAGSTVSSLSFPAGSSEASISFAPAAAQPIGFTLPAEGSVQLLPPVKGAAPGGSTSGSIPASPNDRRAFNLAAVTGCPVVPNLKTFVFQSNGGQTFPALSPGQIGSYALPVPLSTKGKANIIKASGTPTTLEVEIWFSKCPGDVADPLRSQPSPLAATVKPCIANYNYNGGNIYWDKGTPTSIQSCHLPDSDGPYYFNYRHVKVSNPSVGSCTSSVCPNVGSYTITAQ